MSRARRGHNEGSIFQRKDGLWVGLVDLGRVNGKRKRRALYGKTRKEVQEKLTPALHAQQRGLPVTGDGGQTVETFLRTWLDGSKARVRTKTLASYEMNVRLYILPAIGQVRLSHLAATHVQSLQAGLLASGKSASTVRKAQGILHHALTDAVRWDLIPRNIVSLVDLPRGRSREMTPLDEAQARHLLEAVQGHRLEALYVLAVTHGMREGEMLGLRWKDLDLDKQMLQVRQTVSWVAGSWQFSEPKTKGSRRRVDLSALAVVALRAHRKRQLEERVRLGTVWQELGLVFANEFGRPIEPTNLLRAFHTVLNRAGLPRIRFHDLRHTAATLALGRGVHAKVVSEMLGHASIAITLDLYSHVIPAMQRTAASAIDAIYSEKPTESLATNRQQ